MEWLYTKAIPIEAQYLYRKAMELSLRGQIDIALSYFKQAVFIAPRYSQAYYQMGNCFARLGRYTEALEKYHRAIEIDPASPEPREKMDQLISHQEAGERDNRPGSGGTAGQGISVHFPDESPDIHPGLFLFDRRRSANIL
jgi:tetratricopeptide (TPR) repeat protein